MALQITKLYFEAFFKLFLEVSIAGLPGWGELSTQNLAESVQSVASTGVSLSRYIYSLGIPHIGTHASQLVASTYGNIDSFLNAVEEASLYDIEETNNDEVSEGKLMPPFAALTGWDGSERVKGLGPTAIAALIAFSREKVLVKAAKDLASVLTVHDDGSRDTSDSTSVRSDEGARKKFPFEGMTVVFTGTLPGMSRTTAQNAVKDLGAKATPSAVSKSTTLVVEGGEGMSNKARKAREFGIRVIGYAEFMRLIDAT
jgi:DNA ligase (NAD+)